LKTGSFLVWLPVPAFETAMLGEHAVDSRRAGCDDVLIHHQVRQTTITFPEVFSVKSNNRLPFPRFQPVITRHEGVMFVHLAIPLPPVIKLAQTDTDPADDLT
jgi:hypothetical protein